jgi:phage tail-like protein
VSDDDLLSVLPEVFQVAATGGGPMAALTRVASDMHAPIRDVLDGIDRVVDPFRCPDPLVSYLAWWVDLGWLTLPDSDTMPRPSLVGGNARLRDLIASSADLSARRGTAGGLTRFLHLATGIDGFDIVDGADDFQFRVVVPTAAADQLDMITRIVAQLKPAHLTADISVAATDPMPAPDPGHPG